jgi:hypothetical protein
MVPPRIDPATVRRNPKIRIVILIRSSLVTLTRYGNMSFEAFETVFSKLM